MLFVVLRGSHEKLDWPLMMLSLALLYHSLSQRGPRLALHINVFYLVAVLFALVTEWTSSILVFITLSEYLSTCASRR